MVSHVGYSFWPRLDGGKPCTWPPKTAALPWGLVVQSDDRDLRHRVTRVRARPEIASHCHTVPSADFIKHRTGNSSHQVRVVKRNMPFDASASMYMFFVMQRIVMQVLSKSP